MSKPTDDLLHRNLDNRVVLITGGTGTFGKACISYLQNNFPKTKIRVFSRDEFKQARLRERFGSDNISWMLGDVRDMERLRLAFRDVDYVFHAAALKHVTAGEYNPREFIDTNVIGTENVCRAAIDSGVRQVITLASDKGVNPINLYGATKLVAEKSTIQHNSYTPVRKPYFKTVRYGNVAGSRGSVIGIFKRFLDNGEKIPITDPRMTRFWMWIDEAVDLVLYALCTDVRGGVFVPHLYAFNIMHLLEAIVGPTDNIWTEIGIRPGEKLHEVLMTDYEAKGAYFDAFTHRVLAPGQYSTSPVEGIYILPPIHHDWNHSPLDQRFPPANYIQNHPYSSETWPWVLDVDDLVTLVNRALAVAE